ncbi:MAG: 3-methylcrotonyl-CoA carboxylase alpha subunit [Halioglobus sp.]|jgi:3-methylcrotonyl-CoA carboxylase alpha subunit
MRNKKHQYILKIKNIDTILIANRGEIASRVIRTCNKMGIRTIALFSEADKNLPYVHEADVAVHIGNPEPHHSYLDQEKIIRVAKEHQAQAIHPGYGFLSENADFATKCKQANIIFIGPHAKAISAMGSKSEAKRLMKEHGVPIVPGYQGADQSVQKLKDEAQVLGYPVLLKATAGGGGKGMRIVRSKDGIENAVASAKREAQNAFGDDNLILEKFISKGRHIEFQIFGDQHGNIIHILERECSIQRRYQKVIEESPSPILTESVRNDMGSSAISAAKALNYDNAGTVEFIYDETEGKYYFLEVNTRLQVEHPVTEEVTGLDLVEMQIEAAQGLPLRITQGDVKSKGYALETRLYAEDPTNGFMPDSGKILKWDIPNVDGLRIETAIQNGSEISVYYDPMIAKLIVWDRDRQSVIRKMKYVLRQLVCMGIKTNQEFLHDIISSQDFAEGKYDTNYLEENYNNYSTGNRSDYKVDSALIAATLFHWQERRQNQTILRGLPSGWRNNFYQKQKVTYRLDGEAIQLHYGFNGDTAKMSISERPYDVLFIESDDSSISFYLNGTRLKYSLREENQQIFTHNENTGQLKFELVERFPTKKKGKIEGSYEAPMPSQVMEILVKEGDTIKEGDGLIVLSSMKMENLITATQDGTVETIYVEENTNIESGKILLKITEA